MTEHGFVLRYRTEETDDGLSGKEGKCSAYYDPKLERGIAYDDPDLGIEWPKLDPVVSERDANAPRLAQIAHELPFD